MFIMRVGLSLVLVWTIMATTSLNGKFIYVYDAVGSDFLFSYITAHGCFVTLSHLLSHVTSSLYTRLRMGHIGLNIYLPQFGLVDDANCSCGNGAETVYQRRTREQQETALGRVQA